MSTSEIRDGIGNVITTITEDDDGAEPVREPVPVFESAPKTKPKYFVAGTTFYAQMEDGWELAAPIKLSVRTLRTIQDASDDEDELDQLVRLFTILGDTETVDKLQDADFVDAMETALTYFQAWEEKNEARLGKLRRSSLS